jgi:hypothetical protein
MLTGQLTVYGVWSFNMSLNVFLDWKKLLLTTVWTNKIADIFISYNNKNIILQLLVRGIDSQFIFVVARDEFET